MRDLVCTASWVHCGFAQAGEATSVPKLTDITALLLPHAELSTEDDELGRGSGRPQLAKELVYFERAKQRLRNKDAYNDFLKCLSMYTQEIISRQELLQLLNDIIGRFPDLMVGCQGV